MFEGKNPNAKSQTLAICPEDMSPQMVAMLSGPLPFGIKVSRLRCAICGVSWPFDAPELACTCPPNEDCGAK